MNVLVIAPYEVKLLKTIEALEKAKLGKVGIIGSFTKISKLVRENHLKIRSNVINIEDEDDIALYIKEMITDETMFLFGNISEYYAKKILQGDNNNDIKYYHVIDLPDIRYYIFVNGYPRKKHLILDEKKKGIIDLFNFMKALGVKKGKMAILTDQIGKTDILELNLFKMLINDQINNYISITNPCTIFDIFNHNSETNIFKENINMLLFKNYDSTSTFINTLSVFSNCRIASIGEYNQKLFVYGDKIKDEQNILFSLLLINKSSNKVINKKLSFNY